MSQKKDRYNKLVTVSLLWGAMLFAYIIRFALGVVAPTLMRLYDISPKTMGYILSAWNWPYAPGQLFGGVLADRFGPWIVMGVGSGVWGLTTLALPIASTAASLFLMRAIFGLAQSVLTSGIVVSISRVFGPKERARAIAVAYSGNQVGLAVGGTIAALILARLGWHAVFYCLGAASLLLTLAWSVFYPDKRIGRLSARQSDSVNNPAGQHSISWLSLFRYRSTWGMALGQMGYLYALFFFVSWLPGYLILDRKMTVLKTGIISALPFWAGMLGTLAGGWLADGLIQRGVNPTVCRKSIIGLGMIVATVTVITAAFIERGWLAVTLLTLCVGSLRLATASTVAIPIDLAPPSMVGALTSIQNFFATIGSLLAPIVTGYLVNSTGSFVSALVAAGGMAFFGALSYIFLMGKIRTYQAKPGSAAAALERAASSAG